MIEFRAYCHVVLATSRLWTSLELIITLMESECTNLNQISCFYFKISCYLLYLTSPERITEVCKYLEKLSFVLVLGLFASVKN